MSKFIEIYDYTSLSRTLSLIWDCSKKWLIWRIVLLLVQALLPLVPLYLIKLLLDAFASDTTPQFGEILWIVVAFAVVQVLSITVSNMMLYVSQVHSDIIKDFMSDKIIGQSIRMDLQKFDSDQYHDKLQRAVEESGNSPVQFIGSVSSLIQNLTGLAAVVVLLATLHWSITFLLLLIALPVMFMRWYFTNKLVRLRVEQTQLARRSNYFNRVLTASEYAKEVRAFGFGEKIKDMFLSMRDRLREQRKRLFARRSRSVSAAQATESLAIVFALVIIANRAIKGLISVGDIAMYLGIFQKGQSNINNALKALVSLHENKLNLDHLFEFLDLQSEVIDPENPEPTPDSVQSLSFENVSFTYPQTSKKVLGNINLSFKKGQMTAIVGENGSGKSTLVKLIQRFYDPDSGSIQINGKDIQKFKIADLRQKQTVIFQDFSSYQATVKENISYAEMNALDDDNRMTEASRLSTADQFIHFLKEKYDTQLGREFSDGEELSGGQWQKIAMSRAFYRDADIIILDEPTSFIDPLTEDEIFNNFRELAGDKILILITHRLYNLKKADTILVLQKGNVVEQGSHDELMAIDDVYRRMFESQDQ